MSAACWDLDRLQARYGALWDITGEHGAFTAVPRGGGDTYAANSVLVLRCLLSDAVVGLAFAKVGSHG